MVCQQTVSSVSTKAGKTHHLSYIIQERRRGSTQRRALGGRRVTTIIADRRTQTWILTLMVRACRRIGIVVFGSGVETKICGKILMFYSRSRSLFCFIYLVRVPHPLFLFEKSAFERTSKQTLFECSASGLWHLSSQHACIINRFTMLLLMRMLSN